MGVLTTVLETGRLLLAPLVVAAMVVSQPQLQFQFPSRSPTLLARTAVIMGMEVTAETEVTAAMVATAETAIMGVTVVMVAQEVTVVVAVTEETVEMEAMEALGGMEDPVVVTVQEMALTVKMTLVEMEGTHLPLSSTRRSRSKAQALYLSF
jgi:hypothetical protein